MGDYKADTWADGMDGAGSRSVHGCFFVSPRAVSG